MTTVALARVVPSSEKDPCFCGESRVLMKAAYAPRVLVFGPQHCCVPPSGFLVDFFFFNPFLKGLAFQGIFQEMGVGRTKKNNNSFC